MKAGPQPVSGDTSLQKNYLVVGGTRGIGKATVKYLVTDCSANVIFCGRDAAAGSALCDSLAARAKSTVRFVAADIRLESDVASLFNVVGQTLTTLDGAFNAAGVAGADSPMRGVRFHNSDEAIFDEVFSVNVKGIWRCLRRELAIMSRQRHGSVVNCASVAGLRAADSLSVSYTASKHALLGLTRALAVEYSAEGIRVNALCPGVIDTDMLDGMADELEADLRRKNPAARLGTALEVAVAAEFLLSDRSSYISGATLTIDAGGLTGAL